MKFTLNKESIILIIRGDSDSSVVLDGEALDQGRDYKIGHVRTLEGSNLVV